MSVRKYIKSRLDSSTYTPNWKEYRFDHLYNLFPRLCVRIEERVPFEMRDDAIVGILTGLGGEIVYWRIVWEYPIKEEHLAPYTTAELVDICKEKT